MLSRASPSPHNGQVNVERQIREALDKGDFDDLNGAGKPLDLGDPDDPDWWVKGFLRREGLRLGDALPPVLLLRRQRESFPDSLIDLAHEQDVRIVLVEYNRAVRDEIMRIRPGPGSPVLAHTVDIERLLGQWRELRAAQRTTDPASTDPAYQAPPPPSRWRRLLQRVRGS